MNIATAFESIVSCDNSERKRQKSVCPELERVRYLKVRSLQHSGSASELNNTRFAFLYFIPTLQRFFKMDLNDTLTLV